MADNVTANAGSGGAVFATDDIGGVHYPISKLTFGALDSSTLVSTSNGLPVQQQGNWNIVNVSGTVSLPTGAATAAKQPALGTAGTASSDVLTVQGITSMTPLLATLSGTNNIATVTTVTTVSTVTSVTAIANALPAGTNAIGDVGLTARATGGLTIGRVISGASTNATSVKGSAGRLHTIAVMNLNAAARYLKIYNKATSPTVGSDTPVLTFLIPGNTAGAGFTIDSAIGWAFSTGIALAITTGIADADTGAVAANEIVVNLGYA